MIRGVREPRFDSTGEMYVYGKVVIHQILSKLC